MKMLRQGLILQRVRSALSPACGGEVERGSDRWPLWLSPSLTLSHRKGVHARL
ncbi:hypothetical protein OCAR_7233 [Afipia carboxidovorans OM5]|nr:hypothetical protein OCAR_7233 [Afipia carboxidovorans OM5]